MRSPTLLFLVLLAAACTTTAPPSPATGPRIISGETGEPATFASALDDALEAKVVYLGEQHNNDYHHAFQFEMVKALFAEDPRLLIGMEMFQRPFQEGLDAFIGGEIDETEMLRRTEYFTRWGWDYLYYRPILQFARDHHIPVVALNAPREVNRKVARSGLESLTEEERAGIAREIHLDMKAHHDYVKSVWDSHPMGPNMSFENFYASQCIWEDTMAESVADALAAHPGFRMAVIVGEGHVGRRFGIPDRADARGAAPSRVFYGLTPRIEGHLAELVEEDYADWLYVTPEAPARPPTPRLGVMVDRARMKEGLFVTGTSAGSLAALAGVKEGDRIVGLDDREIRDLSDLKTVLALSKATKSTIVVLRDGERLSLPYDRRWIRR